MVIDVSCGDMSPTAGCQQGRVPRACTPTVYAVDANDVFEDRGALVGGLPVQQDAVGLDSSERDEGREGDLEAEHVDELVDGLGEHLVRAEGHPAAVRGRT